MTDEIKTEIVGWLKTILAAIVIAFTINNVIIVNAQVPTGSMENIIMPKDHIVAFRLSYMFEQPQHGDIIVFKFPDNEKEWYVKRIIGVPGDQIEIKEGQVYRNGERLVEDYIKEPMEVEHSSQKYTVPSNGYFVLGDNRNGSVDARYWHNTFVYKEKILGKVFLKYFPQIQMIED
jgi:signal peptidase I